MATVKLRVYPPLSYRMSSQKGGVVVLEQEINEGCTLGDLLDRLSASNPDAWQNIYDDAARQLRPVIVTVLNTASLSNATAAQAALSNGDQITLRLAYGGG